MRFKNYVKEMTLVRYGEEKGKTTKDKGHSHDYFFDRMSGDGGTSYDSGHLHKIKTMVILSAKNHTHKMK